MAETVRASNIVWDTIDFHDIAGLVAGAHSGEGLGNRFLANIRETDAILHVVRAHHDNSIIHPEGRVDPMADIETIETELIFADLEQAERRHARVVRDARGGERAAVAEEAWLRELIDALHSGKPARTVPPPADAPHALRDLGPLTAKPVLFVADVDEGDDAVPSAIAAHAAAQGAGAVAVRAASSPSCASSTTRRPRRCAPTSACRSRARSASSAARIRCSSSSRSSMAGEAKPAQSVHLAGAALLCGTQPARSNLHIEKGFVRAEVVGWDELLDAAATRRPRPRKRRAGGSRRRRDARRRCPRRRSSCCSGLR